MSPRFRSSAATGLWLLMVLAATQSAVDGQETRSWIGHLLREHPKTRLVDLVLPGSHDAGSYAIDRNSRAAPGAPPIYARFGSVAAGWAKTQEQNLEQQLKGGIRYLDLRVARSEGELVLFHGLVSCGLKEALAGVARFARQNPREFVLLDMQAMPPAAAHEELDKLLQDVLGRHLLRLRGEVGSWTLGEVWRSKRSLMVLSKDAAFSRRRRAYRRRSDLDSVWANSRDVKALRSRLDARISRRDRRRFQCAYLTFTPETGTIVRALFSGLLALSRPLFKLPGLWIPQWLEKGWRPNVVAVDFYERTDVVAAAIAANRRMLQ